MPAHLRLRADGQLLELPPGKTTIGSSPRCNLRLQIPGIQPVHCLIVYGPGGLSVRRWAADTRLNGCAFDDAPLAFGDCLALGDVELELVQSQAMTELPVQCEHVDAPTGNNDQLMDAVEAVQDSVTAISNLEEGSCDLAHEVAELEILRETSEAELAARPPSDAAEFVFNELRVACGISRIRCRKLLNALRRQRVQNDELAQGLAEASQQLADLRRDRTDWEQSQIGRESEIPDWELQVQELQRQIKEWEIRLAEQTGLTDELRQELELVRSNALPNVAAPTGEQHVSGQTESAVEELTSVAPEIAGQPEHSSQVLEPSSLGWTSTSDQVSGSEVLTDAESDVSPLADCSIWNSDVPTGESTAGEPEVNSEVQVAAQLPFCENRALSETPAEGELSAPSVDTTLSQMADANLWAKPVEEHSKDVAESAPSKALPASFLDRYSHLFADDTANELSPSPPQRANTVESATPNVREMGVARNHGGDELAAASLEEESIEQYMAKLLQRVRGDLPHAPASQVAQGNRAAVNASPTPPPASTTIGSSLPEADAPETEEEAAQAMVNWDAIARRAVEAGTSSNLGALRALANETARRAIGRHEMKKHRRDAATKVVVATFAGVTSLWLMLSAPSWRGIQFITGCGSLMVAAYWAGKTVRAFLESWRAAAYAGTEAEVEHLDAPPPQDLPIDFENQLQSST